MVYKILSLVGRESPGGNSGSQNLEAQVNASIVEGWKPVGGVSVASVAGPKTMGSEVENWFVRFTQAKVKERGDD
jgi:hypothetical protein